MSVTFVSCNEYSPTVSNIIAKEGDTSVNSTTGRVRIKIAS